MKALLLASLFAFGCGSDPSEEKPEPCDVGTSPEIDLVTSEGYLNGWQFETTLNMDGTACIAYVKVIGAYNKGTEAPETCRDGTTVMGVSRAIRVISLEPATDYAFRLCAYREKDSYTSSGVTKQITTNAR